MQDGLANANLLKASSQWKAETALEDDTWGANEEQYWEEKSTIQKVSNKSSIRACTKPAPSKIVPYKPRGPVIIDYEPVDVDGIDHVDVVIARQSQPYDVTVTAKPSGQEVTEAQKRSWFANLHDQLLAEVKRAEMIGSFSFIDRDSWEEIITLARQSNNHYDMQDIDVLEGLIRQKVKLLITARHDMVRTGAGYPFGESM